MVDWSERLGMSQRSGNYEWSLASGKLSLSIIETVEQIITITPRGLFNDETFHAVAPQVISRLQYRYANKPKAILCFDLAFAKVETINIRRRYVADFLARQGILDAIFVYNYPAAAAEILAVLETAPNSVPIVATNKHDLADKIRCIRKVHSESEEFSAGPNFPLVDLSPERLGLVAADLAFRSPDGSTEIKLTHLEHSIYEQFRKVGRSREQHNGEPEFIEKIVSTISACEPSARLSFLVTVSGLTDLSLSSRKGLMDLQRRLPVVGAVAFLGANRIVGRALAWAFDKFTDVRIEFFSERDDALNWLRACYANAKTPVVQTVPEERSYAVSEHHMMAIQNLLSEITWGLEPSSEHFKALEGSPFLPIRTSIELLRADIVEISQERDRQSEARVRTNRALRDAVTNIAHDIRTPLTSLKLGLGRLMNGDPYDEVGPALHAEVCHLNELFDNLSLMLSRNVLPVYANRAQTNLVDICLRVKTRFELLASDQGVAVEVGFDAPDILAAVDEVPLEQALGNVVHNAIGFATQHVAIVIFNDANEMVIRVDDDGPGIDLADTSRLLSRYAQGYQGQKSTRQGYGLGLSIAQMVVEEHGGRLQFANLDDGGARIEFRLPTNAGSVKQQ